MPSPNVQQLIDEVLAHVPARPTNRSRQWFRIRAEAPVPETDPAASGPPPDDPETVVDIDIYGEIGSWGGDGMTGADFAQALAALPPGVTKIRVHVNSPGGDVFDALLVANLLARHPAAVETSIEGIAASAATIVTQGGSDSVKIADNALVMIHSPWAAIVGPATALLEAAAMLGRAQTAIITTYQRRSPLSTDELTKMLDSGPTWMDAGEALEAGFASEVVTGKRAAASLSPRAFAALTVPEKYRPAIAALMRPTDPPPPAAPPATKPQPVPMVADAGEVLRLCLEAGLDGVFAHQLVTAAVPKDALAGRIAAEKETRLRAEARAHEIRALSKMTDLPELAAGYIAGGMTEAQVREHLLTITAKMDCVEIDAGFAPESSESRPSLHREPVIDARAIYAERNQRHFKKEE